ncbi:hypothetical protein [Thioalkalivibrio sp. HK1]|uniref:hypothetical protein n=1 Tax=Thioalkalivibrio sp. HK1 TaxID=1469245 RepID=UPI00047276D3|nr:hypothetical protein [Thioalkalivibrio sp. HK1]
MDLKNKRFFAKYTGKALAQKAGAALDPTAPIREITEKFFDYLDTRERERTRREEIRFEERKAIARIQSERDIIIEALDRSFEERAKIFDGLLVFLDEALSKDNNEAVTKLTDALTEIVKDNPFANIKDLRSHIEDRPEEPFDL